MLVLSKSDIRSVLNWDSAIDAIVGGHSGARPIVDDILLEQGSFSLFGRGVVLPGHGAGMKVASIYPPNVEQNPPRPAEDAVFIVIDEHTKNIKAMLDGPEITRWKTAADSALGSKLLSREDSETLLILGAGPIAVALAEAHLHVRADIKQVLLWNRTPQKLNTIAEALSSSGLCIEIATELDSAVAKSDIISSATGSRVPLIKGALLKPGAHVDLVGSFQPVMREADDNTLQRAEVYVNCNDTAIEHTGELVSALSNKVITRADVRGDLFTIVSNPPTRLPDAITLYKNGGGAHFDLLVSERMLQDWLA